MEWFIQNDQMAIDGEEAWLVDRNENVLYKADLSTYECEYVSTLPTPFSADEEPFSLYRINPSCCIRGNAVFLMPDRGESILIYDLNKKKISSIEICNPLSVRLSIHDFWEDNGKLWAVSFGLGKILSIDMDKKTVEGYYDIFDEPDILPGHEAQKAGNFIFNVSRNSNKICEFNTILREKKIYEIFGLAEGAYTICYDNNNFWLSGISGKIYLWNKNQESLTELDEYPKDLKIYKEEKGRIEDLDFPSKQNLPIFYKSFILGDFVCFLPFNSTQALCNKMLCVNRKDFHMQDIILNEDQNNLSGIYNLEYLKTDDRAGILCERDKFILEIDINLNIISKKYLKKLDQTAFMYRNMKVNEISYEVTDFALKEYRNAIYEIHSKEPKTKYKFGRIIFEQVGKG